MVSLPCTNRGDGDRHADVLAAELLLTGGGFPPYRRCGVGNLRFVYRAPPGMTEFSLIQRGGGFAIFMVCASSDSRTHPDVRQSPGRIPILVS